MEAFLCGGFLMGSEHGDTLECDSGQVVCQAVVWKWFLSPLVHTAQLLAETSVISFDHHHIFPLLTYVIQEIFELGPG